MLGLKLIRFNKMGPWLRVTKMADHMHRALVWSFTKISLSRVEPGGNVTQFMVKYSIGTSHEWPRPAFYCAMFALVSASVIHQSYWTVDWHWVNHTITPMSISHSHLALVWWSHPPTNLLEKMWKKMENAGYTYWLQATVPSINADRLMNTIGVRCWWSWWCL